MSVNVIEGGEGQVCGGTAWAAQRRLCLPRKANRRKGFSQRAGHRGSELAAAWCGALKAGNTQCMSRSLQRGVEEFGAWEGSTVRWRGRDKSIQKSQVRETGHHSVCSEGGVKLIAKVAQRLSPI